MFVEITSTGLGHPVGEIVDVADGIARAYIDAGQAKTSDAMSAMRSSVKSMLAERDAELKTALDAIKSQSRSITPNPPATPITAGESAGDRDTRGNPDKGPTPGDIVRMLYWAKADLDDHRVTDGMRDYALKRMRAWKEKRHAQETQWVDRSIEHVTGANPGGVARDGAESTQGAATYGYLVRPEFQADVFRIESETDIFVGLREIPMGNSVELRYPALDQYSTTTPTRTSNLFGGVLLYRKPEDAARTEVDAKISEIIFKVTDLTGMTKVSRDLLADSFIDLNGYLQGLFREAFGWRRDWDFFNGTGVGEPQGILTAAATINGGGVSGNATRVTSGKIRYEDLAWMISVIWPPARQGAYWIVNAQAASQLQAIQATSPSGFVYQPNTMVSQAMMPSIYSKGVWDGVLMGFPVKLSEKVPALNTTGDITFFSPRYYGEATRAGLEVGLTEHRYWELDQVGIRWKLRNDGQPMMKKSIVGADGNTYSFCSTLVHL
jgi:HK97 family phage major capsid protein